MNKFPLKFSFEGAFYGAWYITKKNYLGQKIEAETCRLENGKIVPMCAIQEKIDFSDYD